MTDWHTLTDADLKSLHMSDNTIFTFDIETTSYFLINGKLTAYDSLLSNDDYNNCQKGAVCYIWQLGIDNTYYYGRYLEELPQFLTKINQIYSGDKYMYVHNLAFEFQFLRGGA
jgi:hypothetical protein